MKTWNAKSGEVKANWWLIDAEACPLGRLAAEVAVLLRGKHKAEFTPHVDTGDFVIVLNADGVQLTGRKWLNKKYYSHSGFFGSLKTSTAKELSSVKLIQEAVYGMLPKNKMRSRLIKKLKVYKAAEHPHESQKPMAFILNQQKKAANINKKSVGESEGKRA